MREEFEKLPEIAELISDGEVYFDENLQEYICIRQDDGGVEMALNLSLSIFKKREENLSNLNKGAKDILDSVLWNIEDCEIRLAMNKHDSWCGGQIEILEIIKRKLEDLLK